MIWVYTNSVNKSCKSLSGNSWTCFIFHKHLVAWNWHLSLFVNPSEISYKVCIFISSFIYTYKFKSIMKLLLKVNVDAIRFVIWNVLLYKSPILGGDWDNNKYYFNFRIYLNEFEIQNNVGSKVGCNLPAAIGFARRIRKTQNSFVNI